MQSNLLQYEQVASYTSHVNPHFQSMVAGQTGLLGLWSAPEPVVMAL